MSAAAPLTISKSQARRFLLAHHHLWPPRRLRGANGALAYIRHVNCIQYDPINVVGQNPNLVLQSRVGNYKATMLKKLRYQDRALLDGFDKVMSIYPVADWPYFARHREVLPKSYYNSEQASEAVKLMDWARAEIEARGPLSSLELKEETRLDWWWGNTARAARVALDILFFAGEIVVHHRVGTRRYFDLAERLLPENLHLAPNPHADREAYQDWHVLRRVGSLGLAHPGAGERWGGMLGMKSGERQAGLKRLVARHELLEVDVDGLSGQTFYLRPSDLPTLEKVSKGRQPNPQAAFLAALDNVMWDRRMINMLFDFDYVWEVYKPEAKRIYGYYVLPVIYGEQFIGRFDPVFDRNSQTLTIKQWWWQNNVDSERADTNRALRICLDNFMTYLGAKKIELGPLANKDKALQRLVS
ncbi:MAG: winged helix DNA-binding domain-containing protein [Chloroflexi bacterium]|nr:winged helix DNA-binding domain-containing protein [Chloroflexota bacterium]